MLTFDEYRSHDALGLAQRVARGETTPAELLEVALARAAVVEPRLRTISQHHADFARAAIRSGLPQGPFTGVPFLLKDIQVLLAGTVTSHGSALCADTVAEADTTLTERCKRAGLVIFGKTNTPELGLAPSTESARFGSTRNPWDPSRTAGGSSGGAAAAVAAGILPAAQASDGGGSIRIPASCCGVFGLKPTRARVPCGPFAAEGWGGMTAAHMVTRSVRDSAALLDAIQGAAPGDFYAAPPVARPYLEEVAVDPGRLRIALQLTPLSGTPVDEECRIAARSAAALLEGAGHIVEEAQLPGDGLELGHAAWTVASTGVGAMLSRFEKELGRTIVEADVEAVTWRARQHAATLSSVQYANAMHAIHMHARRMAAFHERYDIVLSPTLGTVPPLLGPLRMSNPDDNDYTTTLLRFMPFTNLYNMSGEPSMSVPLHWSADNLPIGVMFSAGFGREDLLFRLAGQLEQLRPWFQRVPPELA